MVAVREMAIYFIYIAENVVEVAINTSVVAQIGAKLAQGRHFYR
jgi:hypothetical protein